MRSPRHPLPLSFSPLLKLCYNNNENQPFIIMNMTTDKKTDSKVKPQNLVDLIDKIDIYLEKMRINKDMTEIPKKLSGYRWFYFRDVNPDKETLKGMALYLVDHMYRYISYARAVDDYTRIYFATVFGELWETIQSRGVDVFYILDNELQEDRFMLTVQLFALSGFAIVTPYFVKGTYHKYMTTEEQAKWVLSFTSDDFDPMRKVMTIDSSGDVVRFIDTESLLEKHMKHLRNIIYIEKDASVNFLEDIKKIAKHSQYLSLFRNHAPNMPQITVLGGMKEEMIERLKR